MNQLEGRRRRGIFFVQRRRCPEESTSPRIRQRLTLYLSLCSLFLTEPQNKRETGYLSHLPRSSKSKLSGIEYLDWQEMVKGEKR